MLSVDYGFETSVKRSGHAACWCASLGGIVQFGGWPPSEQLGNVVRREGSSCPLYLLPATTIARHVRRADQRCKVSIFSAALGSRRQRRLRKLCEIAKGGVPCEEGGTSCGGRRRDSRKLHTHFKRGDEGHDAGGQGSSASSSARSSVSLTTEDTSESSFEYVEGYVSEQMENESDQSRGSTEDTPLFSSSLQRSTTRDDNAVPQPSPLHLPAGASHGVVAHGLGDAVVSTITVDLLRQMNGEGSIRGECNASGLLSAAESEVHASGSACMHAGHAQSALLSLAKGHSDVHSIDKEAPSVQYDTREVRGKHTVRPLQWIRILPRVAPRSRHGHHLIACGERLYVIGGSYWAHGDALASTDMLYDVRKRTWQQISSLFPPRFCASLAASNTTFTAPCTVQASASLGHVVDSENLVLYYFGGSNFSHQLTNTLHRLWLPQEVLEELPQYGAVPREQFKGILVCDVQRECTPEERKRGDRATGRLFHVDGFQYGCPMVPYLRVYNLSTGVWVRVCPSPDLVRGQVSLLQYDPVGVVSGTSRDGENSAINSSAPQSNSSSAEVSATRLRRFEVVGGMPARRGKQRRSRMCYSFDAAQERFDYSHALPVPGLTAHCVVLLPTADAPTAVRALDSPVAHGKDSVMLADGTTSSCAYQAALTVLREECGAWSLSCGGNEDWKDADQNSLGYPVGWLYLLSPRQIPLSEVSRVQMGRLRIAPRALWKESDGLLDELF